MQGTRGMQSLALGAALLALAACQATVEEVPVTSSLSAVPQPPGPSVGDTKMWLENGSDEFRSTVVAVDDATRSYEHSTGCKVSLPKTGFGPTTKFTNCEGNTGTQDVKLVSGSPRPLSVGASWAYEAKGSNVKGASWEATRICEVEGEARITVPMGSYDTFKVVCDDR